VFVWRSFEKQILVKMESIKMMKNEDGKTEQNRRRRISSNVHSAADGTAGAVWKWRRSEEAA
jgi:hypothetical protein